MPRVYARRPVKERLLEKVVAGPNGCIVWVGAKDRSGYGRINVKERARLAHRISYQHLVGEIPDGLELDHLCRNPSCINPNHLEPVTRKVNTDRGLCAETHRKRFAAQTHCKHGHEYTPENTYRAPKTGKRHCKTCARLASQKHDKRMKSNV